MNWLPPLLDFFINRPFLLLGLMALPLFVLASVKNCYPTARMFWLVGVPTVVSLAIIRVPVVGWYLLFLDLVILFVVVVDVLSIVSKQKFTVQREILHIASLGKKHHCEITISNRSKRQCRVKIKDDLPTEFVPDPEYFEYQFRPLSRTSFNYDFVAVERGRFDLNVIHLTVSSWLGFWHSFYQIPATDSVNVYPDMKQISEYDLLARTNRLNLMGVRRTRKIGQDNEFERLRDYTQDDNYKFIDWRTTARRRKLTVRDFQTNQSQRIIFMVDCGRMMTGEAGDINLLDHALNATLMLSYVALRQGDSVGLICFSDTIHNYTPPRSGVNHINRLLHATFDQHPRFVESRYDKAFLYLRTHCQKRSLVVLMTNVIDEVNSHQIHQYLSVLVKRHLPLGVLLKDHSLFDPIDHYQGRPDELFNAAAAAKIANWRAQVIKDLNHQGVLSLDVFPEQLTAALVNQYLEIKAKHLL